MKSITSALHMRVILDTAPSFYPASLWREDLHNRVGKDMKNFTNENQNKDLEGLVKKNNICSRKD